MISIILPKKPVRQIGISPDEREKIDHLVDLGFTDTFRMFHQDAGHYTRWPFQNDSRKRNFGWRLDYFFANKPVLPHVLDAAILSDIWDRIIARSCWKWTCRRRDASVQVTKVSQALIA